MAVTYGTRFPQYLSGMLQILWWELDEAALIFCLFASALIFGGLLWLLQFLVPYLYIRAKRRSTKGFFKHLLYFCGMAKLEGYPTFFERNFIE